MADINKKKYLVVVDVPGIKDYVFSTSRLVEIRGASALLDGLNRYDTPKTLKEELGESNVECIFVGGGTGHFIIHAQIADLQKAINQLIRKFTEESKGGLRLTYGWAELVEDRYGDALNIALDELKKEKESTEDPVQLHTGFTRECDSCLSMAGNFTTYGEDTHVLCPVCVQKEEYGKKRGLWDYFAEFLQKYDYDTDDILNRRPKDFSEIGELCNTRRGYTALVYADGNNMGRLIRSIQTKEQFQFFSNTVDQSLKDACHEVLYKNWLRRDKDIPADILLLGGDDLIVYLAAEIAFPFSVEVASKFTEITKMKIENDARGCFLRDLLGNNGLSISIGLAYGKSHTPFSLLFQQAEDLLKNAKKAGWFDDGREGFYTPAYIDFHLATRFNQVEVKTCREDHLTLYHGSRPSKLYQKPYSLEDANRILKYAQDLIKANIPRTRLNRLGNAPTLGWLEGSLECIRLYSRINRVEQREAIRRPLNHFGCMENIPWKIGHAQNSTVLVDLMEIVDLTTSESKMGEEV